MYIHVYIYVCMYVCMYDSWFLMRTGPQADLQARGEQGNAFARGPRPQASSVWQSFDVAACIMLCKDLVQNSGFGHELLDFAT